MKQDQFLAFVVSEEGSHTIKRTIERRRIEDLPPGDVLVKVFYSSLNYKDALSASGNKGVTRQYPHTPGIDAAGIVADSSDSTWKPGDEVICTGYDLGMNTDGGFGQFVRVPGKWLVRKPQPLSFLQTMQLGTAGFTAALCVLGLETNGVTPEKGPILVTGATGGVATVATLLLTQLGYSITAVSGKEEARPFLSELGVAEVIDRTAFLAEKGRTLLPARWAGVIDTVGGDILATAIKGTGFNGVVTCCGNAASGELPLNVYPFILRGVHLLGIYSANCPMDKRLQVWQKLSREWKIDRLENSCRIIGLGELDDEITKMLAGKSKGRCIVELGD
ncbi:MAG: YhdH/YhfP family quinone oxidoreductase [Desulfobulbus sp.]|nr:YhdH/YhfP family quinone oxidoreductase [Desulfobulbus sp.]